MLLNPKAMLRGNIEWAFISYRRAASQIADYYRIVEEYRRLNLRVTDQSPCGKTSFFRSENRWNRQKSNKCILPFDGLAWGNFGAVGIQMGWSWTWAKNANLLLSLHLTPNPHLKRNISMVHRCFIDVEDDTTSWLMLEWWKLAPGPPSLLTHCGK